MRQCLLIGIAVLASGCTSGLLESDAPPDRIYTLRADDSSAGTTASALDAKINIAVPRVAPGLDTDRIAVRTADHEIDYYRAARWGDSAARIVQTFLVDSLRASGAFALVVPQEAPVTTDYLLDLELRDFQAEQVGDGPPIARVRIVATLIDARDRRPAASFESGAAVEARANRLGAVVAAMEAAASETAAEIARRVADDVRSRTVAGPP